MAGITQVPVGENHAFSIETEVAVNVVLLRKINPMNRVRKPLRAAALRNSVWESLTNWTIPPISSGMTGTVSLTKTRY